MENDIYNSDSIVRVVLDGHPNRNELVGYGAAFLPEVANGEITYAFFSSLKRDWFDKEGPAFRVNIRTGEVDGLSIKTNTTNLRAVGYEVLKRDNL